MKKIFTLTAAILIVCSITSAQTVPGKPQPVKESANKPVQDSPARHPETQAPASSDGSTESFDAPIDGNVKGADQGKKKSKTKAKGGEKNQVDGEKHVKRTKDIKGKHTK